MGVGGLDWLVGSVGLKVDWIDRFQGRLDGRLEWWESVGMIGRLDW